MANEYLMHYGVKGMKWGVRRTDEQLGHDAHKKSFFSRMDQAAYQHYKKKHPGNSYQAYKRHVAKKGALVGLAATGLMTAHLTGLDKVVMNAGARAARAMFNKIMPTRVVDAAGRVVRGASGHVWDDDKIG